MASQKVAVITGASSGIGWALAESFAKCSYQIHLHGLEPKPFLEDRAEFLRVTYQTDVKTHSVDLSEPESVFHFAEQIRALSQIDVLVNNAGLQFVAPIEEFSLKKFNDILHVHVTASFQLIQAVLPRMRAQKRGRIINMSSVHGLVASKYKSAYVAAKHALSGLTKVVALETAGSGITCNAVCPGWVRTPLVDKQISDRAEKSGLSIDAETELLLAEKQPSLQFTELSQIADLVQYLASDSAANLTGAQIPVDGGWVAQ